MKSEFQIKQILCVCVRIPQYCMNEYCTGHTYVKKIIRCLTEIQNELDILHFVCQPYAG